MLTSTAGPEFREQDTRLKVGERSRPSYLDFEDNDDEEFQSEGGVKEGKGWGVEKEWGSKGRRWRDDSLAVRAGQEVSVWVCIRV